MTVQELSISAQHGYMMFDVTDYIKSLNLPKTLNGLGLKDEFHISLLPAVRVFERLFEDQDKRNAMLLEFERVANEHRSLLGTPKLDGKLYRCIDVERNRETIVGTVDFPGLSNWQEHIRGLLGNIDFPVPHITLYISAGIPGLGLNSKADFNRLAKIMPEKLTDIIR